MTVREHILANLEILENSPIGTFKTSDIQELSYLGKKKFGKYLGSSETYSREFRRMRTDGILQVSKIKNKGKQQTWVLERIGKKEDYSNLPF